MADAAAAGGAPANVDSTAAQQQQPPALPPPRPYYAPGSRGALPSCWDARPGARHATATSYLRFADAGLAARYVGPGEDDLQAASCRADRPVPSDAPFYYWELTVEDRGAAGFIGVGFCTEDVNLGRLPGWEPRSYGYHGDDGCAFRGSGRGWPYGPRFGAGDAVGVLLDRAERSIRFFLNGQDLGVAFAGVGEERLYPMVGMRTRGESVRANFGADPGRAPFRAADFWALRRGVVARAAEAVAATALPGEDGGLVVGVGVGAGVGAVGAGAAAGQQQQRQRQDREDEAFMRSVLQDRQRQREQQQREHQQQQRAADGGVHGAAAAAGAAANTTTTNGDGNGNGGGAAPAAAAAAAARPALPPPPASMPLMPALVFQYLMHHRCWRTASLVASEVLGMGEEGGDGGNGNGGGNGGGDGNGNGGGDGGGDGGGNGGGNGGGGAAQGGPAPMEVGGGGGGGPGGGIDVEAAVEAEAVRQAQEDARQVPESLRPDVLDAIARQDVRNAIVAGELPRALRAAARVLRAGAGAGVGTGAAAAGARGEQDDDDAALVARALGPHLLFRVRVQQFLEAVRAGDVDAALAFARAELGAAAAAAARAADEGGAAPDAPPRAGPAFWVARRREDEELLQDALSLLAYEDPAASPCAHLLHPAALALLAERVNSALMARRGAPREPAVERLYRQATAALDELKRLADPRAMVLDADRVVRDGLMEMMAAEGEKEAGEAGGDKAGSGKAGGGGGGQGGASGGAPAAAAAAAAAGGGETAQPPPAPSLMELV